MGVLWLAGGLSGLPAAPPAGPDDPEKSFDLGFIASRHPDVHGVSRLKLLGPFFERAGAPDGMSLSAVRPLYSSVDDPANDRELSDYVWPVGTSRTVHDENQWRFLFFYGFNHTTNDPGPRYRTWLIPLYFQGRDASGKTYRALFPLGGTIRDFAGRDEVTFALFPLYSTSALNDISTVNFLWPLLSRTRSDRDHIYRARFFPFYGVNRHRDKFDKKFILWPIYSDVRYHYPKGHGRGHIVFPLYGTLHLDTERTLWLLPPFFRFTRGERMDITHAPWPFYQRRLGSGIDQRYFWPLWGRKKIDDRDVRFYLWPFFWTETDIRPGQDVSRQLLVPLFSHTAIRAHPPAGEPPEKPEVVARRHKLWPLYSYRRVEQSSHLRFVELWPFADSPSVERNWAPFWSLYSRTAHEDRVDTEVLWGLYRNHRRGGDYRYVSLFPLTDYRRDDRVDQDRRSWNLLKGLAGYERKGSRKQIKLLYFIRFNYGQESAP